MSNRKLLFLLSFLCTDIFVRICSTNSRCGSKAERVRRDDMAVMGAHINEESVDETNGRSAYFSGNEIVEFRRHLLYDAFTVEIWMKPEGGQLAVAPVLNFVDRCQDTFIWILGLKQMSKGRDTRLFFSLKAHRHEKEITVVAHESYTPNVWVHVAAVFNGTSLHLFLNQALVSTSHQRFSPLSGTLSKKCEALEIGGDSKVGQFFRGAVDELRVWRTAKSHREIVQNMRKKHLNNFDDIVLYEKFEGMPNHGNFDLPFQAVTTSFPELELSTLPRDLHQIEVKKPFCGVTICDNPDVVRGYKESSHLRRRKVLRYRLINTANDDGSNPLLSNREIKSNHQKMNEIFSRYNITWEISIHLVKNSSLRMNSLLSGSKLKHLKRSVNLDNGNQLNVFVGKLGDNIHGIATMPWNNSVYGVDGGTVLNADRFGKTKGVIDMVHEFGHTLGLWHVFRGMTTCSDPCFEKFASMELGDLCEDTNPTPLNKDCSDPVGETCGITRFRNTPYRNFMGYGKCPDEFTKDQVARMHCYIDYVYQGWLLESSPSPTPMRPKVLSYRKGQLLMEWLRPLNLGKMFREGACDKCSLQKRKLRQFAVKASSSQLSSFWQPEQATGPPNSEKCRIVGTVWMEDRGHMSKMHLLDLSFEKEVVPTGIVIWATYNKNNAPFEIALVHVDNSITFIGFAVAQCDVPYTRRINTKKATKKVRLRVHTHTGIDAVELISEENHSHCEGCPDVNYVISREPPFQTGKPVQVSKTRFTDQNIEDENISYEYRIQTVVGEHVSLPSLPLIFNPKRGFCGDGIIQKSNEEQCDDGNLRNGDGCSLACKNEDVFKCKGRPSLCYRYKSDGVCEEFERQTSSVDCGFYVPPGFEQQWAVSAVTNPKYCKPIKGAMTGPPPHDLKCSHGFSFGKATYYCKKAEYKSDFWIRFGFAEAVVATSIVLYFESDGHCLDVGTKQHIKIELIDTDNLSHSIGKESYPVTCERHPMVLPVLHDMTTPYFKTRAVHVSFPFYSSVVISAVALRTSKALHHVAASSCDVTKKEYYNPRTHSCYSYACNVRSCAPLVVKKAIVNCEGASDGDTCTVMCAKGYRPSKAVTVKCILGNWSIPDIKCLPVDCGPINIKRAIVECRHGTTFKRTCTFRCVDRAHMVGKDSKVICMADGLWSTRRASCEFYCPVPPSVEGSRPLEDRCDASHANVQRQNEIGTECKFQCMPGYDLVPVSTKVVGALAKLTCNADGGWTQHSKCSKIQCKELSEFERLVYNCTRANEYGSVCRTVCLATNETHEVMCKANGQWSSDFNYCKHEGILCDAIKPTRKLEYGSCGRRVGDSCPPACRKHGYDAVVKDMEEKHNIKLYCLPNKSWHPHPSQVYCVKSCWHDYLGDDLCDCVNNNKHCNYDNGDCCGPKVEFIGSRRCSCRDQKYVEQMKRHAKSMVSTNDGTQEGSGSEPFKADFINGEDEDNYDDHDDIGAIEVMHG